MGLAVDTAAACGTRGDGLNGERHRAAARRAGRFVFWMPARLGRRAANTAQPPHQRNGPLATHQRHPLNRTRRPEAAGRTRTRAPVGGSQRRAHISRRHSGRLRRSARIETVRAHHFGNCAHHRPLRLSWAKLLKRVFDLDLEHRPNCGGELKIIAAILEQPVIEKILTHLGCRPGRRHAHRPIDDCPCVERAHAGVEPGPAADHGRFLGHHAGGPPAPTAPSSRRDRYLPSARRARSRQRLGQGFVGGVLGIE